MDTAALRNTESSSRMSSGIAGLDEILHGGVPAQSSYLIVGGAGSGKTILALHWLLAGARMGEQAMYITLAEPSERIRRNAAIFGVDVSGIDIVDLCSAGESMGAGEYQVFAPTEVEHVEVWKAIFSAIDNVKPRRVVLDSLTQLRYLSTDVYQFRKHVQGLVARLGRVGCTSYLLYEPAELESDASPGLVVDGVMRLQRSVSPGLATGLRTMQIEKLRGSDFISGLHAMRISQGGIEVYPHRIEGPGDHPLGLGQIASGVPALDRLLGGGLDNSATTMLTGPTGVGKSTLATHMMVQAIKGGGRAAIYTFEESVHAIALRARGIGTPIDEYLKDGSLRIVRINPMEVYPDELLGMIRVAVEDEGFNAVTVDSLRGYQLAMEEFGMAQAHIHNLVAYLNRKGVTTIVINEVEHVATNDLKATDLGVSQLADTVVLMRYAERAGRIIKIISTLKRRLGHFEPDICEMRVSPAGFSVGERLEGLRGVLTGSPSRSGD